MQILRAGFPRNGYGQRNDTNEKYTKYGILKPHPRAIAFVNTVKIRDKEPRWCYRTCRLKSASQASSTQKPISPKLSQKKVPFFSKICQKNSLHFNWANKILRQLSESSLDTQVYYHSNYNLLMVCIFSIGKYEYTNEFSQLQLIIFFRK